MCFKFKISGCFKNLGACRKSHIALNTLEAHKDCVGIICTNTTVRDAHYAMFKGLPVQLICPDNLYFAYVPGNLYMLPPFLHSIVEHFGTSDDAHLPPVKVIVIKGNKDITIKILDKGGGIPDSAILLIWTYMYTTMEGQSVDQDFETQGSDFSVHLVVTSAYVISMEGYVYTIHLNRLSSSRKPLH
ncbi:hypothetical protein K439DRAFT_1638554 [Ramaria rubella]|nr:hypothetical protein K439DRAFT_1638554 [Ramaria rubella]